MCIKVGHIFFKKNSLVTSLVLPNLDAHIDEFTTDFRTDSRDLGIIAARL